jgi:hypothetical protein
VTSELRAGLRDACEKVLLGGRDRCGDGIADVFEVYIVFESAILSPWDHVWRGERRLVCPTSCFLVVGGVLASVAVLEAVSLSCGNGNGGGKEEVVGGGWWWMVVEDEEEEEETGEVVVVVDPSCAIVAGASVRGGE